MGKEKGIEYKLDTLRLILGDKYNVLKYNDNVALAFNSKKEFMMIDLDDISNIDYKHWTMQSVTNQVMIVHSDIEISLGNGLATKDLLGYSAILDINTFEVIAHKKGYYCDCGSLIIDDSSEVYGIDHPIKIYNGHGRVIYKSNAKQLLVFTVKDSNHVKEMNNIDCIEVVTSRDNIEIYLLKEEKFELKQDGYKNYLYTLVSYNKSTGKLDILEIFDNDIEVDYLGNGVIQITNKIEASNYCEFRQYI